MQQCFRETFRLLSRTTSQSACRPNSTTALSTGTGALPSIGIRHIGMRMEPVGRDLVERAMSVGQHNRRPDREGKRMLRVRPGFGALKTAVRRLSYNR